MKHHNFGEQKFKHYSSQPLKAILFFINLGLVMQKDVWNVCVCEGVGMCVSVLVL